MYLASTDLNRVKLLRERALFLQQVRSFFQARHVVEVDCQALQKKATLDDHISALEVDVGARERMYLHTSPEYAMKRLLSLGMGDIFYLGHVYRKEEQGRLHSVEFTMIEWYRLGLTYEAFLREACDLIGLFISPEIVQRVDYRDAFKQYVGLDPCTASYEELTVAAASWMGREQAWGREELIIFLFSQVVEPNFAANALVIVEYYPVEQAALACTTIRDGIEVAERFEVYYRGVELANGYHELRDPVEQRVRFEKENQKRRARGEVPYSLDEAFLTSLETMPDARGVSLGFDRLLMLRLGLDSLAPIL